MQTRPRARDGLELIRPPVSYAHRTRPVSASTANSRPSVAPKYATPSTTAGDDSTIAFVRSCHTTFPAFLVSAVTDPSFALTIRLSPEIAGVEGLCASLTRRHRTFPVVASTAQVSPLKVFT